MPIITPTSTSSICENSLLHPFPTSRRMSAHHAAPTDKSTDQIEHYLQGESVVDRISFDDACSTFGLDRYPSQTTKRVNHVAEHTH